MITTINCYGHIKEYAKFLSDSNPSRNSRMGGKKNFPLDMFICFDTLGPAFIERVPFINGQSIRV